MAEWEREIFEKEYADLNWYKGKQAKHVKEMENARRRNKLGMTLAASSHSLWPLTCSQSSRRHSDRYSTK